MDKPKYRWVSPLVDGRTNGGRRQSWYHETEEEARKDAVKFASGMDVEGDLLDLLWRNLAKAGWEITTEERP